MRRRELLGGIGATVGAAVAGCTGSGGSADPQGDSGDRTATTTDRTATGTAGDGATTGDGTTGTTDRSIAVERRVGPGGFNVPHTLVVEDDGTVRFTVECVQGPDEVVTDELDPGRHRELRRLVLAADVDSLTGEFGADPDPDDGTEVVATDLPPTTLTVTVDGRESTVEFVGRQATPERLNRLLVELDRIEPGFPESACSTATDAGEVTATLRVSGGMTPTPWHSEVTATGEGVLEFSHLCKNSDREVSERATLSGEETDLLRRRLSALDLDELAEAYTCPPDDCPTDLPGATLTVRVGDRSHEAYFYQPEPGSVPETLGALREQLAAYADRFAVDCRQGTTDGNGTGG